MPGDECVFGGGKTLRDGLGTHGAITAADGALDFVITNVLVIDAVLGIVKADIGIKDGRIAGIGKAGNPQIMDGVDPGMVVGANTDVRSAEGMIATAGAIDVHVHFDSAGLCEEAIASGITTMLGGGLGPGHGRDHLVGHGEPRPHAAGRRGVARSTSASSARAAPTPSSRCSSRAAPARSG